MLIVLMIIHKPCPVAVVTHESLSFVNQCHLRGAIRSKLTGVVQPPWVSECER